jgi:hypothetical protein
MPQTMLASRLAIGKTLCHNPTAEHHTS